MVRCAVGQPHGELAGRRAPQTPKQSALYSDRQSQALGDSMLEGFSGADRADPALLLEAQVYRDVSPVVP